MSEYIDKASDLLAPGDLAIAVLTRGPLLEMNSDGTGTSGNWKFSPYRNPNVNKVIIFFDRPDRHTEIFVADYIGAENPTDTSKYKGNRYMIVMAGIRPVGITRQTWKQFADTGSYPVRFLRHLGPIDKETGRHVSRTFVTGNLDGA